MAVSIESIGSAPATFQPGLQGPPPAVPVEPPAGQETPQERPAERPQAAPETFQDRFTDSGARNIGLNFRIIDNPHVVQARVIDRATDEVLREIPTTPELRFSRNFRKHLADFLGQKLDVKV